MDVEVYQLDLIKGLKCLNTITKLYILQLLIKKPTES